MARRRRVLLVVAVVLDALAIAVLVADVVAAYQRETFWLLALSAIGIPLAVAGAVTSGIRIAQSIRRVPRWVLGLGVAAVTIATLPIGGLALGLATDATPNPAATAESIVGRTVEAAGGQRLCGSGDPGLGPDNTQPYFSADYAVPSGADLRPTVTAQASRLGWTVSSDPTGDIDRTNPRLQLDPIGTADTDSCGRYEVGVGVPAGTRVLRMTVLLPYRSSR